MQNQGITPNAMTFACVLKACGNVGAAEKGEEIHREIDNKGFLGKDNVLANALVDMYAKCGSLAKAQKFFDELQVRNVVSWTALIVGYCQQGRAEDALHCFEKMQGEGVSPDRVTFGHLLQACSNIRTAEKGKEIHAEILRHGFLEKNSILWNALVDMYAKCGALTNAQKVFDELPVRDAVSWNTLITGYCEHNYGERALECLEQMQHEGHSPDAVTFACMLRSSGSTGAMEKGRDIHAEISRKGLLRKNIVIGNALVDMYAKFGELSKAQKLFNELSVQDVVSWNALIGGYAQAGNDEIAFDLFNKFIEEGIKPSPITFIVVLHACNHFGLVERGQMYFETMSTCYGIFPTLEHQTCMVDLFGHAGHFDKALAVIKKLPSPGNLPAWFALLRACGKWGNVKLGRLAFEHAVRLDAKSAIAHVCMSDIFATAGMGEHSEKMLAKAQQVFEGVSAQDVASWNMLITGYCQHGQGEKALDLFERLEHGHFSANVVTFLCILKACGKIGALEKGKELHDEIIKKGLLGKVSALDTALVVMYAECGAITQAQEVFDRLPVRDVIAWTALMAGYCHHGHGEKALDCFKWMKCQGLFPDAVTLAYILKAFGTIGAVEKGQTFFETMSSNYGIVPASEHYSCLVDLHGHAGDFDKAMTTIKNMPPAGDHYRGWFTFLGACQEMGNAKLGKVAFEHAVVRMVGKSAVA